MWRLQCVNGKRTSSLESRDLLGASRSIRWTSAPIRLHIDGNFDSRDHATNSIFITPHLEKWLNKGQFRSALLF